MVALLHISNPGNQLGIIRIKHSLTYLRDYLPYYSSDTVSRVYTGVLSSLNRWVKSSLQNMKTVSSVYTKSLINYNSRFLILQNDKILKWIRMFIAANYKTGNGSVH